jgi:hypothetical protein
MTRITGISRSCPSLTTIIPNPAKMYIVATATAIAINSITKTKIDKTRVREDRERLSVILNSPETNFFLSFIRLLLRQTFLTAL